MGTVITTSDNLFEVDDVFGKKVRTTNSYWKKITEEKHTELSAKYDDVIKTLQQPDEVYESVQDAYIRIFYRMFVAKTLVVIVKYIEDGGFVVTCYETTKEKRKGKKIW